MTTKRHPLIEMLISSVRDPRGFAPGLVALTLSPQTVWLAVVLMSVLSTLLVVGLPVLFGGQPVLPGSDVPVTPLAFAGVQIGSMALFAYAIARIGALFGGRGNFGGALRIVAWLQFVMIVLSVIQFITLIFLTPLLGLVSLASFLVIGWVATGLIAGLHGFKSLPIVFAGIVGSFFAIGFALSLIGVILFGPRG